MSSQTHHKAQSVAKVWLKALQLTSHIEDNPRRLFADIVQDRAMQQPDQPALISSTRIFTYRALTARIHRYARWAQSVGINRGKSVCLMMK